MTDKTQLKRSASINYLARLIVLAGVAVFGFYGSTHMVAAGDTWVALACGRHHANHGVKVFEPFSFNSHTPGPTEEQLDGWPQWTHGIIRTIHPTGWINQNWLTHLTFYKLVSWFGTENNPNYNMLVIWKFALFITTSFVVYGLGRVLGVNPLLAGIAACFSMIIGRSFFDIRPACWSNFFVPLYLLVLALATYRSIRYIWLLVPLIVIWANFHGGYIYAYMMIVPFCGLHVVSLLSRNRLFKIPFKNILTIGYAAVASFIAMLIFNPYHLTNLTHTFEISISEHAKDWRSVNEWQPAFDFMNTTRQGQNPVGDEEAFGVMCILFVIVFATWMICQSLRPSILMDKRTRQADIDRHYANWPRIDLPMLVIGLMTTYMAIQSRRFIAIAGPAVCPIIFLLIQQAWQAVAMKRGFTLTRSLDTPSLPAKTYYRAVGLFGLFIACCLIPWHMSVNLPGNLEKWIPTASMSWKFKSIYLDPWPEDPQYNSIFMRMTASNVKPMDACKFITDNQMTGRIFNYWTEGGAIAFGEKPDPITGEIPLKLFMDGRAQAAYNHDKFTLWQATFGGLNQPAIKNAYLSGKPLTSREYELFGEGLNQQFKASQVWVVMVPLSQQYADMMKALQMTENWKTAYYDPYQWILVDTSCAQGRSLIDAVLDGKALFPNELSKKMTLARLIPAQFSSERAGLLEQTAIDAFVLRPCVTTWAILINTGTNLRKPSLIINTLARFIDDFEANQHLYRTQSGYLERLRCAMLAADRLSNDVTAKRDFYSKIKTRFETELGQDKDGMW